MDEVSIEIIILKEALATNTEDLFHFARGHEAAGWRIMPTY